MNRVGDDAQITSLDFARERDATKLGHQGYVTVPLDFLRGISIRGGQNVERRPPKLRLNERHDASLIQAMPSLAARSNIGEDSQVSFQVAELIIRRMEQIEESGDLGALRGFAALDRIVRMYEHVFVIAKPETLPEEIE